MMNRLVEIKAGLQQKTPSPIRRHLRLASLVVLVILCFYAHRALAAKDTRTGFVLLGTACLLLILAAPRLPEIPYPSTRQLEITTGMRRTLGIACLVGGVILLGQAVQLFWRLKPGQEPDLMPWNQYAFGLALWMIGGLLLTRSALRAIIHPIPAILLCLIVGLAAFLRLYHFSQEPFGIWYDEAINALYARDVLQSGNLLPVFRPNITGVHLYLYATALKHLGQTNIDAVRLVSALFGILTVGVGYLVGDQLRGPWFGLLMAFFLATFSWSINFSRIAMTGVETGFFILLTYYFLIRLVRHGRLRDAFWVGLSAGLGLWFYSAFRLMLVPMAFFGLVAWRYWRPGPFLLIVATAATTLALTIFPLAIYARANPKQFTYRTKQVSIQYPENRDGMPLLKALKQNTEKHLLMFHVKGDTNGRHNLPGDPMLDPITGIFFALGLGLAVRRLRHHAEDWFFLGVMIVGLSGGILTLTFEAPQGLRTIGVLPAIAYFCALAALAIGEMLYRRRVLRPGLAVLTLVLAFAISRYNFVKYFDKQAHWIECWMSYSTTETLVGKEALHYSSDQRLFMTQFFSLYQPSAAFLAPNVTNWEEVLLPDALPLRISPTAPASVFLHESETPVLDYAQTLYPHATIRTLKTGDYGVRPGDVVLLYIIDLKPSDIAEPQGLTGGREGVLYAPDYAYYRLWGSPDTTITLDGQEITQGADIRLAKGNHALNLSAAGPLEWEIPGITPRSPVPDWALYHTPVSYHGLHAYFYPNANWSGEPTLERIDPVLDTYFHRLPMDRPYSVIWKGWLNVPKTGQYGLGITVITSAEVLIDSQSVLSANRAEEPVKTTLYLTAGRHPIEVRYLDAGDYSRLHLLWSVNGQDYVPIPNGALDHFLPASDTGSQ